MKDYLEFEINIFLTAEVEKYESKTFKDEEEDETDRLIKESLYGKQDKEDVVVPTPIKAKILIDPERIEAVNESFSLLSMNNSLQDNSSPIKDQITILFKSGTEQTVNCTLKQFKAKLKRWSKKYEIK